MAAVTTRAKTTVGVKTNTLKRNATAAPTNMPMQAVTIIVVPPMGDVSLCWKRDLSELGSAGRLSRKREQSDDAARAPTNGDGRQPNKGNNARSAIQEGGAAY
jgi:hypothetical protein